MKKILIELESGKIFILTPDYGSKDPEEKEEEFLARVLQPVLDKDKRDAGLFNNYKSILYIDRLKLQSLYSSYFGSHILRIKKGKLVNDLDAARECRLKQLKSIRNARYMQEKAKQIKVWPKSSMETKNEITAAQLTLDNMFEREDLELKKLKTFDAIAQYLPKLLET